MLPDEHIVVKSTKIMYDTLLRLTLERIYTSRLCHISKLLHCLPVTWHGNHNLRSELFNIHNGTIFLVL
jgi:hypothetical protein